MSKTAIGDEIEEIVREKARDQCEECGTESDLSVHLTSEDNTVSLDNLALLCSSCYTEHYTEATISPEEILEHLQESPLPFLTTSIVADEFGCVTETARKYLNELVDSGKLERYELESKRKLYFKPDYEAANELVDGLRNHISLEELDTERVEEFAKQPYKVLPRGENEYYVVAPRWLPFSVGHLYDQDDAWSVFLVNKYIGWISDLPENIHEKVDLTKTYRQALVDDGVIELADETEREQAWENMDGAEGPLDERVGSDKIRIQDGKEFEVIADIIDGGNLPFVADGVDPEHMRSPPRNITLRNYQQRAFEKFQEYGQAGVYWPPGSGKTFISLYTGDTIKGEKLVVVPSTTLESQWRERIDEHTRYPEEWTVCTYQYLTHNQGQNIDEFSGDDAPQMVIFDESHHLPANSYSKLSMIDATYRLGLSASPYREDGRSDYIIALTGYPVDLNWQEKTEYGFINYPDVVVWLYRTQHQKKQDIINQAQERPGKGLIFCDDIDDGEELSEALNIPFVNGDTPHDDRSDIIKNNRVTIVSRVGDEGLSIENLDWSVEYRHHGSSRRQEIQRTGRLFHSDSDNSQHIIQMTDQEMEKHHERLYSLEENGIDVRRERRDGAGI